MIEHTLLMVILATFLLAGLVKGVIGLGLPTISLSILTIAIDLPTAMGLLLVPSFVTNLWQALTGGHGTYLLKRLWPFLLMATAMVWLGALALTRIDIGLLSILLGLLLVTYAITSLTGFRVSIAPGQAVWTGPLVGSVNGILTGMTGSFVVPGVMYLQAIGLNRGQLIQSMGMLFTASTLALALALQFNHLLFAQVEILSAVALVPALIGMVLGQWIRTKLSDYQFQRGFFGALLLLGIYIIFNHGQTFL